MNQAGQLFEYTVSNRDGTNYAAYLDPALPGDPLYQLDYANVGGSWSRTLYDVGNQTSWSKEVIAYTAASVEVQATFTLRSGSTEVQVFDQAHGDALQTDTTYNPDGTANQWVYDTAGTNPWYQYKYDAGANGVKVNQSLFYRNGNTEVLNWDPAHGDALQYDSTFYTNGTAHQVANDTAGVNGWSTLETDWYSVGGQVSDQTFFERDGVSNTNFYATNGALTSNVTIGAGGEKAETSYTAGETTSQVSDENGRLVYNGWLSPATGLALATPGGYTLLKSSWYATPAFRTATFMDNAGDKEARYTTAGQQVTEINDSYADGSSDISIVSLQADVMNTVTSTFDSKGNLRDIIENTTQGGSQNIATFTAAEVMQSLNTPGTLSFIEQGIKLLLVNTGMSTDGLSTSTLCWQALTGGATGQMLPQLGGPVSVTHEVGSVLGATSLGAGGAIAGFATGKFVANLIGLVGAPETDGLSMLGARAVIATFSLGGAAAGVGSGWTNGGNGLDLMGNVLDAVGRLLSTPPPPGDTPDINSGGLVPNPDPPQPRMFVSHTT